MAESILSYLAAHPDAQDTLEGIVEWWLLEERIKEGTALVRGALLALVAEGLVVERLTGDSRIHYSVAPGKREDIRAILEKRGPD